ncbi:acyl-CoA dehydrogenase family protein [Streptomyces canus]|uniref:acyl-CoA dehydrogenase family protein n=1 Tax=Streptomyces canus TaxID=58343 RepID=UPI000748B77A|nr:acyl-CoA dehydrogenase family protein [Streptomyces canus]KUN14370.1 acyl-CoA dehydrogenase [Streptomyces canus]
MRFLLDAEQRAFAASLDAMLTAADTPSVVRDWSRGDHASGSALWRRIAEAGVFALAVPEAYEGLGQRPVELALAFVELGRHAVPGPLVETVTAATLLASLDDTGPAKRLLPALASGESPATVGMGTYTLDADMANIRLALSARPALEDEAFRADGGPGGEAPWRGRRGGAPGDGTGRGGGGDSSPTPTPTELRLSPPPGPPAASLDPARRLFPTLHGGELLATDPPLAPALLIARLTTAAQALGAGLALLDKTVAHVKQRTQFGTPIGSFQAVKHQLADAKIALEFARPLVLGAALTMTEEDVAAAKVTACEAAYATARTALQLHGAIGYTAECDLSLWLTKARALRTAWGSPDECRDTVLSGGRRW